MSCHRQHAASGRRADESPRRGTRAFTLLEIVVAISLFGLIMAGVISCWEAIVKGTDSGRKAAAAAQRARVSMKTIEMALTTAEISKLNINFYAFLTDTSGKFAFLSMASRLPADFPGSGLFGDAVMRRVTFDVEKGPDNQDDLIMNQYPLLMITSDQYPPYPITLARDVTAFNLEFWSPTEEDWMTEFGATNDFPPMIRITIAVGHNAIDPSIPYEIITRVVSMPAFPH